ncbi:hypothetical protein N8083_01020 [Candidatus Pacebacteria bacterium]|nr:hypothetical protein [Candidatus Paceibacterota bacterium]
MGITLVINPGSTSKKYALYKDKVDIFTMRFEETGDGFGVCREKNNEQQKCETIEAKTYKGAMELFISSAVDAQVISGVKDIAAIGVRVVAPGDMFSKHQKINDAYIKALENLEACVPLHIPAIVAEMYAAMSLIPNIPLYGISDSAFHTSIPVHRKQFAINKNDSTEYDIKRFGYHGLSMSSIATHTESFFGFDPDRTVVVHVGGGVSVTALHYQESVDTSMGYSPASGVMMGSRVGDFDADALVSLMARKGMRSISTISEYLNRESGFKGMTGYSDLRFVLNKHTEGDCDATLALQMFRYQLHRQIGGHVALLGGLDAFIFTGTAVVRNPFLRAYILDGLSGFGLSLDSERNDILVGKEGMIHADWSEASIGVMKNDEMGEIAKAVEGLIVP